MSALTPDADMLIVGIDVYYVPQADVVTRDSIGPLSDLASPRAFARTEHERAELDLSHGASDLPERKKRYERDAQKSGNAQRANNAPAAKFVGSFRRRSSGETIQGRSLRGYTQRREQHGLVRNRNNHGLSSNLSPNRNPSASSMILERTKALMAARP